MNRHVVFLLSAGLLIAQPAIRAADSENWRDRCSKLEKNWLELNKLTKELSQSRQKQEIREQLEQLYRDQGKFGEANFIASSSDNQFEAKITSIQKNELKDFPKSPDNTYRVSKQKSGTYNFTPIVGCTGHFSITPESSHYVEVCKHVGDIEIGQIKSVPNVPFTVSEQDRVIRNDAPAE